MPERNWLECPIGELIAAYELSGITVEQPDAVGVVRLTANGTVTAGGGTETLLTFLKQRRDEVVAFLSQECGQCGQGVASKVVADGSGTIRVCEPCYQIAVSVQLAVLQSEI